MAKTNLKVKVQTPRNQVRANYGKQTNYKAYVPEKGIMTGKQVARLGKMQQRTTRRQIKQENLTSRYVANKAAGFVKAAGEAVSKVTTPYAATLAAQRSVEASYANKNQQANSLNKWNELIGGNPDKEKGSDGDKQYESTTNVGGGGSILGG